MLAITLWPEFAWAIATIGRSPAFPWEPKDVENRSWHPGIRLPYGTRLAIHAGTHIGGRPGRPAAQEGRSAVVDMLRRQPGLYDPLRWADPMWPLPADAMNDIPRSAVVALATVDSFDVHQRTPWDVSGQWHWRLRDVAVLRKPVPCRGAQGIWTLPGDVELRVLEQVAP